MEGPPAERPLHVWTCRAPAPAPPPPSTTTPHTHTHTTTTTIPQVQIQASFRPGDVVRAEVLSLGDARSYHLTTAKNHLGVVHARSVAGAHAPPGGRSAAHHAAGTLAPHAAPRR